MRRTKGAIIMTECSICGRPAVKTLDYCKYHEQAHENLKRAYKEWEKRSEIDWNIFLDQVYELNDLGQWVREVIDHLMS
jgi:hypothetical protein